MQSWQRGGRKKGEQRKGKGKKEGKNPLFMFSLLATKEKKKEKKEKGRLLKRDE